MKILLLSQYDESQATTRIRLISIKNELKKIGYSSSISFLINWNYKKQPAIFRIFTITFKYFERFLLLFFRKYDLIIFNREVFPKLPFFFDSIIFKSSKNIIMDLDDGTHLYYKNTFLKKKIYKLANKCYSLSTANINLYSHFKNFQSNIYINYPFPDKIYLRDAVNRDFIIGWIGSSSTTKFLIPILKELQKLSKFYSFSLIIVGGEIKDEKLKYLEQINHQILPWNFKNEEYFFKNISLGLMPLDLNSEFANFKSGYKLIQYLCHSIPSLSSKNKVTKNIIKSDLFLCRDIKEWKVKLKWIFEGGYKIQEKWMKKNKDILINDFKKIPRDLIPF